MPQHDDDLSALREQLQVLGIESTVHSCLVSTILSASAVTLWRWRKNGDIPEPPLKNRYPLSWLFDLMAARSPGGPSAVTDGARLLLRLAKADGMNVARLERLTRLGRPVLVALQKGNLEPSQDHLRALMRGLGVTLIDLYRLGRVAGTMRALGDA